MEKPQHDKVNAIKAIFGKSEGPLEGIDKRFDIMARSLLPKDHLPLRKALVALWNLIKEPTEEHYKVLAKVLPSSSSPIVQLNNIREMFSSATKYSDGSVSFAPDVVCKCDPGLLKYYLEVHSKLTRVSTWIGNPFSAVLWGARMHLETSSLQPIHLLKVADLLAKVKERNLSYGERSPDSNICEGYFKGERAFGADERGASKFNYQKVADAFSTTEYDSAIYSLGGALQNLSLPWRSSTPQEQVQLSTALRTVIEHAPVHTFGLWSDIGSLLRSIQGYSVKEQLSLLRVFRELQVPSPHREISRALLTVTTNLSYSQTTKNSEQGGFAPQRIVQLIRELEKILLAVPDDSREDKTERLANAFCSFVCAVHYKNMLAWDKKSSTDRRETLSLAARIYADLSAGDAEMFCQYLAGFRREVTKRDLSLLLTNIGSGQTLLSAPVFSFVSAHRFEGEVSTDAISRMRHAIPSVLGMTPSRSQTGARHATIAASLTGTMVARGGPDSFPLGLEELFYAAVEACNRYAPGFDIIDSARALLRLLSKNVTSDEVSQLVRILTELKQILPEGRSIYSFIQDELGNLLGKQERTLNSIGELVREMERIKELEE